MGKKILSFVLVMVMVFLVGCSQDGTTNKQIEQNEVNTVKPTLETIESTASPTANEVDIEPTESPSVTQATITVTPTPVPNIDNTQKPSTTESTVAVKPTASTTAKATASATSKPTVTQTSTTASVPMANVTAVPNTIAPSVKPTEIVTVKPTAKPTAVPTKAPTVKPTVKPIETLKPTNKPTQTVKPTATSTASPTLEPYNDEKAQFWVDYAKDYAVSIGLNLSSGCAGSWDNPIAMYARIQDIIEENINSRLSGYKNDGVKSVWIWYEKYDSFWAAAPDEYKLYIGYAY